MQNHEESLDDINRRFEALEMRMNALETQPLNRKPEDNTKAIDTLPFPAIGTMEREQREQRDRETDKAQSKPPFPLI